MRDWVSFHLLNWFLSKYDRVASAGFRVLTYLEISNIRLEFSSLINTFASMIQRQKDISKISKLQSVFRVTAILGARQTGKTTLAKQLRADHYFDLENPVDLAALDNPNLALGDLTGTIVIDEVQRRPELFPVLRYLTDYHPNQNYVILGSASRELIRQSSESLAGRIGFHYLYGFNLRETGSATMDALWLRGGFPRSFLAKSDEASMLWRENFITTFLERDIPQLGIRIPARTLRRFWMMLSNYNAQTINFSELARSFGISDTTARNYVDLLEGTFMIHLLRPYYKNIGKRLVRSPKLFFNDTGIFHSLLSLNHKRQLIAHHKLGASWECFAMFNTMRILDLRQEETFFYATHSGAEIDLFFMRNGKNWGVEFKFQDAPGMTRSLHSCLKDLELEHVWIVYPGAINYSLHDRVTVTSLMNLETEAERISSS
jgi:predicted AAA+ superfamily ATPase